MSALACGTVAERSEVAARPRNADELAPPETSTLNIGVLRLLS